MRGAQGLTLIETIVAIAVCSIVLASLAVVTGSSLRESRAGNFKTQATQVLDTVGRRIAGGEDVSLLPEDGQSVVLSAQFLQDLTGIEPTYAAAYEVTVENAGPFAVASSSLDRYRITVCYAATEGQRCVASTTLGR